MNQYGDPWTAAIVSQDFFGLSGYTEIIYCILDASRYKIGLCFHISHPRDPVKKALSYHRRGEKVKSEDWGTTDPLEGLLSRGPGREG